jgi:hypothetical protein
VETTSPPCVEAGDLFDGTLAFDEATGRTLVFCGTTLFATFDPAAQEWEVTEGSQEGPPGPFWGDPVYDTANDRLIFLGPSMWAFDGRTQEWIELLPAATTSTSTTTTTAPTVTTDAEMVVDSIAAGGLDYGWGGPPVAVSAQEGWVTGRLSSLTSARADGLSYLADGAWQFSRSLATVGGEAVYGTVGGLAQAPDGTVWAATSLGVSSFDGEGWTGRYDEAVPAAAVAQDGTVWIGSTAGDPSVTGLWLARWDGSSWIRVDPGSQTHSAGLGPIAMTASPDGVVWMGGGCVVPGLFRYDGTTLEEVQVGHSENPSPGSSGGTVCVFDIKAPLAGMCGSRGGSPMIRGMWWWPASTAPPGRTTKGSLDTVTWQTYTSPRTS